MISDKALENKIRTLKTITPRSGWVVSTRANILSQSASPKGFAFAPNFFRKYAFSSLMAIVIIGVAITMLSGNGRQLAILTPSQNNDSIKYLSLAEQKVTKLNEILKSKDNNQISAALSDSMATIKEAANKIPDKASHNEVVAMANKAQQIARGLNEARKELGQNIAFDEQKILADKMTVVIEEDIAQTHKQLEDAVRNEISRLDKSDLSDNQRIIFEQVKSDFSEYIKTRDVKLLQSAVERIYFLTNEK